jgi:hypothetical protein
MAFSEKIKALFVTGGAWRHPRLAKAFENRRALAGLWISDQNSTSVSPGCYRRARPFHLLLKPFLHSKNFALKDYVFCSLIPVWRAWLARQDLPQVNVMATTMVSGVEAFDVAERVGALNVLDCPNSHTTTYFGAWQREFDIWCPGKRVSIPRSMFARMNRKIFRVDLICKTFMSSSKAVVTMAALGLSVGKNICCCIFRPFNVDCESASQNCLWSTPRKAALAGKDFSITLSEQIRDLIPSKTSLPAFCTNHFSFSVLPAPPPLISPFGLPASRLPGQRPLASSAFRLSAFRFSPMLSPIPFIPFIPVNFSFSNFPP